MAATSNNKLENCEVCLANKAKYTCPKCEVRTCSTSCVNIHKKELECDGIRDKTKYIPLNKFTDLDLLNDYRLLEDIGRSVEKLQKNPSKRCTRQIELPTHLYKLKSAARVKGVNLEFMPQNFSRHKENTTFLNWKTNELSWRVELIFPQAENSKWVLGKVLDTKRLSTLLEEILTPAVSTESKDDESFRNLLLLQSKLKYYQACGITGLKALLKAERVEKSDSRFFELDMTLSLSENFKNKTIIENPIIYIILKDHSDMFEIIDSDDEEIIPMPVKQWHNKRHLENREKPKINQSTKDAQSPVNYFFNADISDSEDEESTNQISRKNKNQVLNIPDYNELVKMKHDN